jgi:hypothetical protein
MRYTNNPTGTKDRALHIQRYILNKIPVDHCADCGVGRIEWGRPGLNGDALGRRPNRQDKIQRHGALDVEHDVRFDDGLKALL